eukprot:CAMPEP_0202361944 /NCGR_PEP_ID=MMETSP1126-20121109/14304_1 /ASSEMBLY_ACC=CAM_ASM_000457 /TAXON_ID=3047 /ORGANISM="Dunaliella tertiolecta, Strain CCMP1320" /LENGTH=103 /DNA_ID=CAMNT_0048955997 /DNA_START=188 /DNA_END=499 /DNA_ORIENTATION=-
MSCWSMFWIDCVPSPTEDQQPSAPPPILPATEGMDPGKKGDSKLGWCEDEAVGVLVLLPPLLCKVAGDVKVELRPLTVMALRPPGFLGGGGGVSRFLHSTHLQ